MLAALIIVAAFDCFDLNVHAFQLHNTHHLRSFIDSSQQYLGDRKSDSIPRAKRPALSVFGSSSEAAKSTFYSASEIPNDEVILKVVEGRVPDWLRGSFFRNGPGLFNAGEQELNHLFDGYSLVIFKFKITVIPSSDDEKSC